MPANIITGTNGDDYLRDYDPADTSPDVNRTISGLDGNDEIIIYGGDDTVYGGAGNDIIDSQFVDTYVVKLEFGYYGELVTTRNRSVSDHIEGGEGNDLVKVGAGSSTIYGGDGYDTISCAYVGGQFTTDVSGYQVERTLDDSAKAVIDLKAGIIRYAGETVSANIFYYDPPGSGLRVDVGTFRATGLGAMNHTFSEFESAAGAAARADVLRGTDRTDVVEVFAPGKGFIGSQFNFNDVVVGRGGVDMVSYAGEIGGVRVNLARGEARGIEILFGGVSINLYVDKLSGIEGAYGSNAADILRGDSGDNYFNGGAGDDTIIGGGGFDIVTYALGEFGNITGGGASGFVGASNGSKGVTVNLGAGTATDDWGNTDTLSSIEGVVGSVKNDKIRGDDRDNSLYGGLGKDTLSGAGGNDQLEGEEGDDTLNGGADDDRITGGAGADGIYGGGGNDTLDYSAETGTLGVNVTLKNNTGLDTFGDTDTIFGIETIIGTAAFDLIKGDNRDNVIFGGGDRDNLGGLGGDDVIFGGSGNDQIGGGDGKDILNGNVGDDKLFGGKGRDELYGGGDNDILFGEKDADKVYGGKGDDQLRDTQSEVNIIGFVNSIKRELRDGVLPVIGADARANHLMGEDGKDKVFGTGYLEGGEGKDELRGAGYLDGGDGNDSLFADPAHDEAGEGFAVLSGGLGNDSLTGLNFLNATASYVYSQAALKLDLASGTAMLGAGDNDTLSNISEVIGTGFDDVMKGGDIQESLFGLGGNDRITIVTLPGTIDDAYGGEGNDKIFALGDGQAYIVGGAGADRITVQSASGEVHGGGGNDTIVFLQNDLNGHDKVYGGADNDTIRLNRSGNAYVEGGGGNDTLIVTSDVSLNDRIVFEGNSGIDTLVLKSAVSDVWFSDFDVTQDLLWISAALPNNVSTFVQMKAAATNDMGGVLIELAGGGELFLSDLRISDLNASMFDFLV